MIGAHVGGVPVEESILALAPVGTVAATLMAATFGGRLRSRRRAPAHPPTEEQSMTFAYVQTPADSTWETYERIMAEVGEEPIEGLIVHVAEPYGERGVRIVDVWESREDYERFRDERLVPAVARVIGAERLAQSPPPVLDVLDVRSVLRP